MWRIKWTGDSTQILLTLIRSQWGIITCPIVQSWDLDILTEIKLLPFSGHHKFVHTIQINWMTAPCSIYPTLTSNKVRYCQSPRPWGLRTGIYLGVRKEAVSSGGHKPFIWVEVQRLWTVNFGRAEQREIPEFTNFR